MKGWRAGVRGSQIGGKVARTWSEGGLGGAWAASLRSAGGQEAPCAGRWSSGSVPLILLSCSVQFVLVHVVLFIHTETRSWREVHDVAESAQIAMLISRLFASSRAATESILQGVLTLILRWLFEVYASAFTNICT